MFDASGGRAGWARSLHPASGLSHQKDMLITTQPSKHGRICGGHKHARDCLSVTVRGELPAVSLELLRVLMSTSSSRMLPSDSCGTMTGSGVTLFYLRLLSLLGMVIISAWLKVSSFTGLTDKE